MAILQHWTKVLLGVCLWSKGSVTGFAFIAFSPGVLGLHFIFFSSRNACTSSVTKSNPFSYEKCWGILTYGTLVYSTCPSSWCYESLWTFSTTRLHALCTVRTTWAFSTAPSRRQLSTIGAHVWNIMYNLELFCKCNIIPLQLQGNSAWRSPRKSCRCNLMIRILYAKKSAQRCWRRGRDKVKQKEQKNPLYCHFLNLLWDILRLPWQPPSSVWTYVSAHYDTSQTQTRNPA